MSETNHDLSGQLRANWRQHTNKNIRRLKELQTEMLTEIRKAYPDLVIGSGQPSTTNFKDGRTTNSD